MYETFGTFDANYMKEMKHYLIPTKGKLVVSWCYIILLIGLFANIKASDTQKVVEACGVILLLFCSYHFIINRNVNNKISKSVKLSQGQSVIVSTKFDEDAILVISNEDTEPISVAYTHLDKLIKMKKYILIYTKDANLITVYRQQLSSQEENKLLSFIRTKAPQIKIKNYDIVKVLNWFMNITLIIAVISTSMFFIAKASKPPFSREMSKLTNRKVRNVYEEINQGDVTAAIFDTYENDNKSESYLTALYRASVHHMGYTVTQNGRIVDSGVMEIGWSLNENEYYTLPIKKTGQTFVAIALPTKHIEQVSYLGKNIEYIQNQRNDSEPVVKWCYFLVDSLNVNVNDIEIDYTSEKDTVNSNIESNEKEDIYEKMLNTVDYFRTVQGTVKMQLNGESEVTVQYQANLNSAYTSEIVQGEDVDIEVIANEEEQIIYNNQAKGFLKNTRMLQRDPVADTPAKERTTTENGINTWYYRDDPTGLVYAKESVFPQERIFGYLYNFEWWDILDEETYAGRECWVLSGKLEGEYSAKLGISKFLFKVDKETGCLLSYEGYDTSENIKDYIVTNEITYNAPTAVTSIDESKYEGYTDWTEESLKVWEEAQ